jgi:hypothetical protein
VLHDSEEVAALFEKEAEELLAQHGKRALAKALAALGGVTAAMQPRSLLDGRLGWSTICAHPQPQVLLLVLSALILSLGSPVTST